MDFYRQNIVYSADRYEIWEAGQCLDQGMCAVTVKAISSDLKTKFIIEGADELPLSPVVEFYYQDPEQEILSDRLQYFDISHQGQVPSICNIFPSEDGDDIAYIRFAVSGRSGYKIIEFYGRVLSVGEKIDDPTDTIVSASKIIAMLKQSRSYNSEALFKWAAEIFSKNEIFDDTDLEGDIKKTDAILESLKLFVESLKCERRERDYAHRGPSMLYPKYCHYIALCNYKLGNYNLAYHIANKGIESLDGIIERSILRGIDRDFLGQGNLRSIMDAIEAENFDDVDWSIDSGDIDETVIDTERYEDLKRQMLSQPVADHNKPSEKELRRLIGILDDLGKNFPGDAKESFRFSAVIEMYKNPLLMAWQKCGYGWHTDFWEEGHSMLDYMIFEMNAGVVLPELISSLSENSMFAILEMGGQSITKGLIKAYTYLQDNITE